jgi:putative ABC transport system permease protein
LAGALLVRAMRTLLFGVGVWDVTSFAIAPAALMIVATVASYAPARRAARVDPVISLRAD